MKKIVLIIIVFLNSLIAYAQNEYRVEINQVYPNRSEIYSNAFNFKREMENAIASQIAKLKGGGCNYVVIVRTPSGNEVRNIQNIGWVEFINGKKSYHKNRTFPEKFYEKPTIWKGGRCNIDGSFQPQNLEERYFVYRVSLDKSPNEYETAFLEDTIAKSYADSIYFRNNKLDKLLKVNVYKFSGDEKEIFYSVSNDIEYQEYIKKTQALSFTADSLRAVRIKLQQVEDFKAKMQSIVDKKDFLNKAGIYCCLECLSKVEMPDSIFISEKLDSVYLSVLELCLKAEKKKYQKVEFEFEFLKKQKSNSISILLFCTRLFIAKIIPSQKR